MFGWSSAEAAPGLGLEAMASHGVARESWGQHLERDRAAEAQVLGAVDHTHAAFAELADDAVVGQLLADVHRFLDAGRGTVYRRARAPASCRCVAVERWKSPCHRPCHRAPPPRRWWCWCDRSWPRTSAPSLAPCSTSASPSCCVVSPRGRWPDEVAYRSASGAETWCSTVRGFSRPRRRPLPTSPGVRGDGAVARHGQTAVGATRRGARARQAVAAGARVGSCSALSARVSTTTTSCSRRASSTCRRTRDSRRSTWRRLCC